MKKTAIILSLTFLCLSEGKLFAQEKCMRYPLQISLAPPVGSMGSMSSDYKYHFSFNVLVGSTCGINGFEMAGLVNRNRRNVFGFQLSGIGNITGGNVKGLQIGGLFSLSDSLTGAQINGLLSRTGNVDGMQISGIANINSGSSEGLQVAGIVNSNAGNSAGLQVAGITNINGGNSEGLQVAGIANINGEDSKGIQIAGIYNRAKVLNGLQIGLININDTIAEGLPIGLINLVKKGRYDEFVISVADYQNLGVSYKYGTRSFYNIYSVGMNILEDNLWVAGLGFGHLSEINANYSFQPEIVLYSYFPTDFKGKIRDTYSTHVKFGFVTSLSEKLALSFAPGVYASIKSNKGTYSSYGYDESPLKPVLESDGRKNNSRLAVGFGFSVGLVIR